MIRFIQKISNAIFHILPFPNGHPWDYVAHFVLRFTGTLLFFAIFTQFNIVPVASLISSAILMLIIGAIKEIGDKRFGKDDTFSDMVSNVGGVLAAIPVMLMLIN